MVVAMDLEPGEVMSNYNLVKVLSGLSKCLVSRTRQGRVVEVRSFSCEKEKTHSSVWRMMMSVACC